VAAGQEQARAAEPAVGAEQQATELAQAQAQAQADDLAHYAQQA